MSDTRGPRSPNGPGAHAPSALQRGKLGGRAHGLTVYNLAPFYGVLYVLVGVYASPVEVAGAAIYYIGLPIGSLYAVVSAIAVELVLTPPADEVVRARPTNKIIGASIAVEVVACALSTKVI